MGISSYIPQKIVPCLFVMVLTYMTAHQCQGRTIDEMMFAAMDSVSAMDFLADDQGTEVLLELDMIVTMDQYEAIQELGTKSSSGDPSKLSRRKRKATRNESRRWTKKEIPYQIEDGFKNQDEKEIKRAIQEWEENTCIRFRQATNADSSFVRFVIGRGCSSWVGMKGKPQDITLAEGCRSKGIIAHEIGHAVGFYHEQSRPDRDSHVKIVKKNIKPNYYHNFRKYPESIVSTLSVPYDYKSIMHYGGNFFSTDRRLNTIETLDPSYQNVIGNRNGLSFYDIKLANLIYKCNEGCSSTIRCQSQGFVGKDCKCYCPGDPVKLCDDSGSKVTDRTTTMVTTPTTIIKCADMNERCPKWARAGYCQISLVQETICKESCGRCRGTPITVSSCSDMRDKCELWQSRGFCKGVFENFMTEHCPKSCNVCGKLGDEKQKNVASFLTYGVISIFLGSVFSAIRLFFEQITV